MLLQNLPSTSKPRILAAPGVVGLHLAEETKLFTDSVMGKSPVVPH